MASPSLCSGSGWGSVPPTKLCSSNSGSRGWSAGWARYSCRMARPGPRPPRLAARCVAGAATCKGGSTGSTPASASRSSSALSEVGPAHCSSPPSLGLCPSDLAGREGRLGLWRLEQSGARQRGLPPARWRGSGQCFCVSTLMLSASRPCCPSAPRRVAGTGGHKDDLQQPAGVSRCY